MNIYSILLTKPHNLHHLNRYYKFIMGCKHKNHAKTTLELGYTETHHICPKAKSLFPEYTSLKYFPDNGIILTGRQHLIAHAILAKVYPSTGMSLAYLRLSRSKRLGIKLNSRQYELNKIQQAKEQSVIAKDWYLENDHPRGFKGKKHSAITKGLISVTSSGENNGMYGKSRPDLAKSNVDPVLKARRGRSSGKTKILKNCKLYGFNTTEECYDYFSKIIIPFVDYKPYIFTIEVSEKFKIDFPEIDQSVYPLRNLLKYLGIKIPQRAKRN